MIDGTVRGAYRRANSCYGRGGRSSGSDERGRGAENSGFVVLGGTWHRYCLTGCKVRIKLYRGWRHMIPCGVSSETFSECLLHVPRPGFASSPSWRDSNAHATRDVETQPRLPSAVFRRRKRHEGAV